MNMNKKAALGILCFLAIAGTALASSSASYNLDWNVVAGGGGPVSSASYGMQSTVDQPLIGPLASASYGLGSGYWYGIGLPSVQPGLNEVYFNPNQSIAGYNSEIQVAVWANTSESFTSGALNITYQTDVANVTNWAANASWDYSTWDSSASGREWITFVSLTPKTGRVHIGNLTIKCMNSSACTTPLRFIAGSSLVPPPSTPLTLKEMEAALVEGSTSNAAGLAVTWKDGSFSCRGGICGDVNADTYVDISDVTDLLYYVGYPGSYTLADYWAADVNGDGAIDISDVTDLLYFVGYPGQYTLHCRT